MADAPTIAIGDVLDDKYEITDILGEGAMGVVYLALHTRLGRTVALKTLRSEIAGDSELVERFEREARAASAIGHANIVQVFDAGGAPGAPYLVMENLSGASLGALLEEGPLEIGRAIRLCAQVLAGLQAAHEAGIVHRDLKPDNIFVSSAGQEDEVVKILDFGISKILDKADPAIVGDGTATRAGMVMGTPLYMSPEQASGRDDLDHRTDLWALACVLYECVSGTPPFAGENYNQILAAVLRGRFVPLRERAPSASAPLSGFVDKGLAAQREARFASANAMQEALLRVSEGAASGQAEEQMLAAFDNIADRFRQQEVSANTSKNTSTSARAVVAADDRFAPPDAVGPISLALDVERSPRAASREVEVARSSPRKRRRSSQYVTRDAPKNRAATLAKVALLLALLAAGALGYRYYAHGYIIAPEPTSLSTLVLELSPNESSIYLDGKVQPESTIQLVPGASAELRLRADMRLVRQEHFEGVAGAKLSARVRLPSMLPSIWDNKGPFELIPGSGEPVTAALVDSGMEKLRSYLDCGLRLGQALEQAQLQPDSQPLPRTLVDECALSMRLAADAEPAISPLDAASLGFAEAIVAFDKAARDQKNTKGASGKILRARQSAFTHASKEATAMAHAWMGQQSSAEARWLAHELELVARSEPDSMHLRLREVAVRSDAWMRARLAGSQTDTLRQAALTSFAKAEQAALASPELYKARGGVAFLRAIRPLMAAEVPDDPLFWHNQAMDIFNQLLLPIESTGTAQ